MPFQNKLKLKLDHIYILCIIISIDIIFIYVKLFNLFSVVVFSTNTL